jgi:hypothetical protein
MDQPDQKDIEDNTPVAGRRIPIDVLHISPMGNGKYRVKIKQNNANLIDLHHQGREYTVIRNLGRGRYIMRLAAGYNTEMIMTPKRKFTGDIHAD